MERGLDVVVEVEMGQGGLAFVDVQAGQRAGVAQDLFWVNNGHYGGRGPGGILGWGCSCWAVLGCGCCASRGRATLRCRSSFCGGLWLR